MGVLFAMCSCSATAQEDQVKIAVFNFSIQNIEASGYGSNITNQLSNALEAYPALIIMDRKELEHFLAMNEFQQNDNPQNILAIGNRLGLEIIVAGKVLKQNSNILVDCRVFNITRQVEILHKELKLLGDAKLGPALKELAAQINQAVLNSKSETVEQIKPKEKEVKETCKLTAKPGRSKITLHWQSPETFQAVNYKIYRAIAASGPFIKLGQTNESFYQDTDAEDKVQYFYKIKAYNAKGDETEFSAVVQASLVPAPEPPIILKAESHVRAIAVFWTPNPIVRPDAGKTVLFQVYRCDSEDGLAQIIGRVEVKESDQGTAVKSGLQTYSILDQSLKDGTEYFYAVAASNPQNHESDFSKRVGQKTVGRVEQLEAEGDLIREIRLKWQAVEAPLAKGYVLYRRQTENEEFREIHRTNDMQILQYADKTGLEDSRTYSYFVTVYEDPSRETAPSSIASAQTKGPPPGPERVEAESGLVKKVKLQWAPVAAEEVAGYKLYRAPNAAGPYQLIATLNDRMVGVFTDTGPLENNTTYYYRLTAFNPVNVESIISAEVSAQTKAWPHKPEGLWAGSLRLQKVPLDWHANNEEDILHYHIYRKESGSNFFTAVSKTGIETHYTDTGLKNGTEYTYQIQAEDKDGLISEASDPVSVRTKPRPQAPQGMSVRYENKKAILSWQANPETDVVSYVIYERFLILVNKVASVPGTEYRINGLSPGSSKTVFITAVDRDGLESEYSTSITITAP